MKMWNKISTDFSRLGCLLYQRLLPEKLKYIIITVQNFYNTSTNTKKNGTSANLPQTARLEIELESLSGFRVSLL